MNKEFFQKPVQIKPKILIGTLIISLFFGFVFGYFVLNFKNKPTASASAIQRMRLNDPNLKYTNPLLVVDTGDKKQFYEYKPLEKTINQFISDQKNNNGLIDMGVYYRDLLDGSWTGINEDSKFSPGSLQKVALMIAYYKLAETDPSILKKVLTNNNPVDSNNNGGIRQTIEPSKTLSYKSSGTVEDLIGLMISHSDNNATDVLYSNIDDNSLKDAFSDLGISFNENTTHTDYISPKQVSLFFRVLYNSSYLSWANSEHALSLMDSSDFTYGLVAGLPQDVSVSHKFGEGFDQLEIKDGKVPEELHDCGIVYYPNHPYFLCVMTKGNSDVQTLENDIQTVSSMVYDNVKQRYK